MILNIEQEETDIRVSYFNKEGEVDFKIYKLDKFQNWYVCSEGDRSKSLKYKNWNGKPVKQAQAKFLNKSSVVDFLDNLPPEDKEVLFAYNIPKMYFLDIEVEVTDGFPEPEKAENKILTCSIASPDKIITILGLKDLSQDECNNINTKINEHFKKFGEEWTFNYIKFKSEYDLVYTLLQKYVSKIPVMSGWNFINYDWKYIYNRCKRLKINPEIASPVLKLDGNDNAPMHVGLLDYLRLYLTYDRSVAVKESNTLAAVSESVLGVNKIKNPHDLQTTYEQHFTQYVYYNAVDSILVHYIDQKLRLADVLYTLAYLTKTTIYKASSPVNITETLLAPFFKKNGRVLASENKDIEKSVKYEGAYVKTPIVGFHKGVACFDFASLYPSIMRQFNISPENLKNKYPASEVENVRETGELISVNGCHFNKEDSYLRVILTQLYNKRKEYKGKSFDFKLKLESIRKQLEKTV